MKEGRIHQIGGVKAWDREHTDIIRNNTDTWKEAHEKGKEQFSDLELARSRAGQIREHVIHKLDNYLKDFESRFSSSGGKVIWAPEAKDAVEAILRIIDEHKAEVVVKSKSAATEEIDLNRQIRKNGSSVYETDLGEFIVDLAGEASYHFLTPAMHYSAKQVSELFSEKMGMHENASPGQITAHVRDFLRKKYALSGVAITGANFLLATTGSVVITENEGNAFLALAKPAVHIVVAGIDKILPGPEDLSLFLPMLSTYATGQRLSSYNHIVSGPETGGQKGHREMYVILLDNGRSKVMADEKIRPILKCIHCGACLNVCPVYKSIGGHAYGSSYQGPFGAIFEPARTGMEQYTELPFASTLCGDCNDVCPVNIDLRKLLLYSRKNVVDSKKENPKDARAMKAFRYLMYKRKRLERSHGLRKLMLGWYSPKNSGPLKPVIEPVKKSFHQLWKERQQNQETP